MAEGKGGWEGSEIKMKIKERTPLTEPPEKEISLTTVILAGLLIWVLVFAALFSWAAFIPCSFLEFLIGPEGLDNIRQQGCEPTDPAQCSNILQNKACAGE
jgi:hypothetical protein